MLMWHFLLAVACESAPVVPPADMETEFLVGTWKIDSGMTAGRPLPKTVAQLQIIVQKDSVTYSSGKITYNVKLDASQKPKRIEFTRGGVGPPLIAGIYRVEGEQLIICFVPGQPGARPTEFTSTLENRQTLWVFKRAQK